MRLEIAGVHIEVRFSFMLCVFGVVKQIALPQECQPQRGAQQEEDADTGTAAQRERWRRMVQRN